MADGGIAVTPDGATYVTRLDPSRPDAVFRVGRDGQVEEVAGLSPRETRLGVAYHAPDHTLYVTQFRASGTEAAEGAVVALDLAAGQVTTVVRGLGKPIGVARVGKQLVVTDAKARIVYRIAASALHILAHGIDRPDSVCAHGPHAVLVTTYNSASGMGAVRRIWLDGGVETLVTGPWEPRGIAANEEQAFVSIRRGGRILVVDV